MSEIYEALKKAEQEKEGRRREPGGPAADTSARSGPEGRPLPSDAALPSEEYRKMASTLQTIDTDRQVKTVLLLSSVHGEGTSTVCAQFARSVAQGDGKKILLVDANLRHPTLHELFDLERESGLTEFLEGGGSADTLIRETNIPGLSVITAGAPTEDAPRLLGSPVLKKILPEWRERYSWVIFDTSPALAYADAVVLGRLLDGVILVVQAGKTRWEVIRKAQEILTNARANVLGVILNKRQYFIPKPIYRRL
jgi:capsular exopolysaccharide synthesis family protein